MLLAERATMKSSLQANTSQTPDRDSNGDNHASDQSTLVPVPTRCLEIAEEIKKEKSWFPSLPIPTDMIIRVDDHNFYIHKLPLISKSEYLSQLDLPSHNPNYGYDIKLENFPGGAEIFEIILKFCYGFPVDLTASNVAAVRCASEFLQMTGEYEEGNLISKTEAFLTFIVLSSWRDPIAVMKSCESLSPWAENLHILRRCSDSIASKISRRSISNETEIGERWWFDDVSVLCIDHFARIITTTKAKGLKQKTMGACIMQYAEKWLPDIEGEVGNQRGHAYGKVELHMSILSGRREDNFVGQNKEQRKIIETLVSILPPEREAVTCKFLLWMLKMALVYSVTPALVSELEKKIGIVLEDVVAEDLLIPNYNNRVEGRIGSPSFEESPMHDVDVVQRILEYFLMHEQQQQIPEKFDVGKLIDGYISEVARDPALSISKFQALAEALPQNARACHDGLYRAIDTYLKTHPTLMEHDRRRLCKAMDCEKLSFEACTHAAQNDRLPLRTVMQVLFSEQVKMRVAMNEKETIQHEIIPEEDSRSSTKKEIKAIILELQKIRTNITELQQDYSDQQIELEKINKPKSISTWSSGWKKFKNSKLFNGKIEEVDTEVQPGQTPGSRKNDLRRRKSYS